MHNTKTVTKSLAGLQDFQRGVGKRRQNRANKVVVVDSCHLFVPVETESDLSYLDPVESVGLGVIVQEGSVRYYQYGSTQSSDSIKSAVAGGWWSLLGDEALRKYLNGADGFRHIGQFKSWEELKTIKPTAIGDRVLLESMVEGKYQGSGEFVAFSGNPTEVKGVICVPDNSEGMYWKRTIKNNTLTVEMCGALADYSRLTNTGTDSTEAFLAAAAYCRAERVCLAMQSVHRNFGYFINDSVDVTDVASIYAASASIFVNSSTFSKTSSTFVFRWGNDKTNYSDISGFPHIGNIMIEDVGRRASELNGFFFKFTGGSVGRIWARNFNGSGITTSPVFDTCYEALVTERCGSLTKYSIVGQGNGDETNSCDIGRLLCHDAYHKGVSWNGSKHSISEVHIEATAVLTLDDGYTSSASGSGLKYLNHQFYLVAGNIGTLTINDYAYADGKTYFDDQTSLSAQGSHTRIVLDRGSSVNAVNNSSSNSRTSLFGGTSPYGVITSLYTPFLYVESFARITVLKGHVTNSLYSYEQDFCMLGGLIAVLAQAAGTFQDVRIDAAYSATPNSLLRQQFTRVRFIGGIASLCTADALLTDCTIASLVASSTTTPERALINGGSITGDVQITDGTSVANSKRILFSNVRIGGNVTMANNTLDGARFVGECRVAGTVTGWALPNGHTVGTIAQRIGPSVAGDGIIYLATAVNSDSKNTWTAISSRP